MPNSATTLMAIPGHIDPVPVPRALVPRNDGRIDLLGLTKADLRLALETSQLDPKQAKLRAKQLWHWIYNRGVTDFGLMTDIAKTMQPWLRDRFVISRPQVVEAQVSTDGTRKWLLRTDDGNDYEMVFIPDADRGTLCISSQVGCTLNCSFCHTGTMRLVRNLRTLRNRRSGDARARRAGRMAESARGPDAHQHRADGDGRAALQFRQCPRCDEDRDGRRRHRPVAPPHHAVDPAGSCR